MLTEDGYKMTLNESTWMMNRGNLKIGNGYKYNNFYPLMAISPEGALNIGESRDSNLWHGRLGHMSQAGLDWLMAIGVEQATSTWAGTWAKSVEEAENWIGVD